MFALKGRPRILLVDDDPHDRGLAAAVLAHHMPDAVVEEVSDAGAFARSLAREPDLVITEVELGWADGAQVLGAVRDRRPDVPLIALSRRGEREVAVGALKAGFADFLVKSSESYLGLPAAVEAALEAAEARRRLARAEPRLQALLDRAGIGVFRSTLDQRLVEANAAFLRLLGVESLREALEVDLPELYFRKEGREELIRSMDREGRLHAREVELRRADGSSRWVSLTEILLLDADGELVIDGLVEDISDYRAREQAAASRQQQLERSNEDLKEFAQVASHELTEPLRTVERYASLLGEELQGTSSPEARESLGFVLEGARRMQHLLDDLLAFSRIRAEGQTFAVCSANELVDQAVRSLQPAIEESRAEIHREDLPAVLGDASQLLQVFQNLLSNALKFHGEERPRVEVAAEESDEGVTFSVRDNGIGIDRDQADAIFGIFRRLQPDYPGTGIGLAICKWIVERHGGRIWVESEPGSGSTFYFTLPRGEKGEDRRAAKSRSAPLREAGKR